MHSVTRLMGAAEPEIDVQPENVVASSEIDQELDLEPLAEDLGGVNYDPDNFPGLTYRIQDPRAAVLIFRSGKLIATGASSIESAREAIQTTMTTFKEIGLTVPDEADITVQNIVCTADLGEMLNLNAIAIGLGLEHIEYEPEQFPGLVYRLPEAETVVLLFGSGKVVITGGTRMESIEDAVESVTEKLEELDILS